MRNPLHSQDGSALLVTMMITSIVLILAMILLEKIVPYSRQIRNMQDSLQAYYTARSEVELGKLALKTLGTRANIDPDSRMTGNAPLVLGIPKIDSKNTGTYVVVAQGTELPLSIQFFKNDVLAQSFGTYPGRPESHLLSTFDGGTTFDLSGTDISSGSPIMMKSDTTVTNKSIIMEFFYSDDTEEIPFFGSIPLESDGSAELMNATNENAEKLGDFLAGKNCKNAHCSMKIRLSDDGARSLPIEIHTGGIMIPDINSLLVADGLSANALYHSRIVEIIPVTQSI